MLKSKKKILTLKEKKKKKKTITLSNQKLQSAPVDFGVKVF
jgi:hypothetical protein